MKNKAEREEFLKNYNVRFLSRGKRIDNGDWVYGNILCANGRRVYIVNDHYEQLLNGGYLLTSKINVECFEVDPDTRGQCTGLKDKNGRLIFEGDIVASTGVSKSTYTVLFDKRDASFKKYGVDKFKRVIDSKLMDVRNFKEINTLIQKDMCPVLEIIGNIHDNPELLESEVE